MLEATIAIADAASAFVERYAGEDEVQDAARRAGQRAGCTPLGAASGAALRFLAAAFGARAVVEVGTGYGSSGIWLLRGMAPDGILTTVDWNPERQEAARASYQAAGFASNRARLITGTAEDVLPRLTGSAYDMVFLDADTAHYADYLPQVLRIVRKGGVAVVNGVLGVDSTNDGPLAAPDPATAGIRETTRMIREDETLLPLLLPVGDGLLAAINRG